MPENFEVSVRNNTGSTQSYYIFSEAPKTTSGAKVFQTIFGSATVPQDGSATFRISKKYYAIAGSDYRDTLDRYATIRTSSYEPVSLESGGSPGTSHYVTARDSNVVLDISRSGRNCAASGGCEIITDDTFGKGRGSFQWVGIGCIDPRDPSEVKPLAVLEAHSGTSYSLAPREIYYIACGRGRQGSIVDGNNVVSQCVKADFEEKESMMARATHQPDGNWNIIYN